MSATSPAPSSPRSGRGMLTGTLLRFISCGLLSVSAGLIWRVTLAPSRVDAGSAFAGIFFLLCGFMIGGILWYVHDARRRSAAPETVDDERTVFSFVVFALMPFAVLLLVGAVWLLAVVIG